MCNDSEATTGAESPMSDLQSREWQFGIKAGPPPHPPFFSLKFKISFALLHFGKRQSLYREVFSLGKQRTQRVWLPAECDVLLWVSHFTLQMRISVSRVTNDDCAQMEQNNNNNNTKIDFTLKQVNHLGVRSTSTTPCMWLRSCHL